MSQDFEKECQDTVDRIAKELQEIYEGKVPSENEDYDEEQMTLREYFDDYLDVDYIVNSSKEYQSCRVWVTLGGPGICIDTSDAMVRLYWGSTTAEAPISYNVRDEIDGIFEEIYNYS